MTLTPQIRAVIIATVCEAMRYRHAGGAYAMGSADIAGLYRELGLEYGHGHFPEALRAATDQQLQGLLESCAAVIALMNLHPTVECPHCRSIVEAPRQRAKVDCQLVT